MSKLNLPHLVLILTAGCSACSSAFAAPPDAGSLLNEQRQPSTGLPDRLPSGREKDLERPALPDTGARIAVQGFRFSGGEELATEAELQELVSSEKGKTLSFTELQGVVARITAYLREKKGYLLARAYLPKQDVTAGIIEIAILAGKVDGRVKLQLKSSVRIHPERLQSIADAAIPEAGAIRLEDVERAALLMNDLPGIQTQAALERGESPGSTRIVLNAEEGQLLNGLVLVDNYGDRYTGAIRGMAQLAINDPFGRGEQFSVAFTGAEHMNQGRLGVSLPLTASGLTANAAYSSMRYQLGKDFSALNAKGTADTFSLGLNYPLIRSRNANLWLQAGGEHLKMEDDANGARIRDRELNLATIGLAANLYDTWGGGGLTNANFTLYHGRVDLSGLAANAATDAAGPRTAGNFTRGIYSAARLQKVSGQLAAFISLRGQFADGNLDSSQKFILGGPTGVRAYPVGEASGDEGYALTVEGRYDLTPKIQVVGFADHGQVTLHHQTWAGAITTISGRNRYHLSGAGIGLNITEAGRYSLRASVARKIGSNPGRSLSGQDSDNTNNKTRLWLQAAVWF